MKCRIIIIAALLLGGWIHGNGSAVCPQGSALPDGCPGAPTGSIQYPTLFSVYSPARPAWNVAGVDFYVGVPSSKTPRALGASAINLSNEIGAGNMTFSATGGSGSTPLVTITGNNITVDTWNFNGVSLKVSAANVTVQNNSFLATQVGGVATDAIDVTASSGLTLIQFNKIDGGVGQAGMSPAYGFQNHDTLIEGSGNVTIQYNWYTNGVNDHIDIIGLSTGTITIQYNIFDNYSTADTHGDGIQTFGNGGGLQNIAALYIQFNLFYMPANWSFMNSNADGNSASRIGDQNGGTISNPVFAFNSAVYPAPSLYLGFAAIVQWGQTTNLPNAFVHDNWFDPNGIEFSPISTSINTATDVQTYNNKTLPNNAVFLNSQFEKFWTDPSGRPGGAPSAPVITSAVKSGSTAVLNGTAAASVTVTIIDPNNTNPWASPLYGSTTSNGSGNWTFTTGTLSAGSHGFVARQTDNAANTSAASATSNVTI